MYGLIGEKLAHSFSKEIHEQLADYEYELCPLTKERFNSFMKKREFHAINVTIPYKQAVIPYLDQLDEKAAAIGAVNTIVHKNGRLIGYNTDYDGFLYTLKIHDIHVSDKKVIVLGNGGAAQAVKKVLNDLHVKELILVKKNPSPETLTYEDAYRLHTDAAIIINTSPVGMYPNNDAPIDLSRFPACKTFVDVIYNPLHTACMMQASRLGMKSIGGLEMLVAQAKAAAELFLDKEIEDDKIKQIYHNLQMKQMNLVLIGMPSSGKTTLGKLLAERYGRKFVDLDEEIVAAAGTSIPELFRQYGEAGFRDWEEQVTAKVAMEHRQIIATGGGCIKRNINMIHLKQNGLVIFLDRKKELLATQDAERPLSGSKEQVYQMYDDRFPLYQTYADLTVKNNGDLQDTVNTVNIYLNNIGYHKQKEKQL